MRIASHNEGLLQRSDIKGKDIYQPGQRGFNNIKVRKRAKYSGADICLWACITFSQCSAKKCSTFNLKIVSDTYSLSFITLFLTRSQHTHTNTHAHTHTHTHLLNHSLTIPTPPQTPPHNSQIYCLLESTAGNRARPSCAISTHSGIGTNADHNQIRRSRREKRKKISQRILWEI